MTLPGTPNNAKNHQEQDRIKVAVRMRPSNSREVIRRGDHLVIECNDHTGDILVNDRYQTRRYTFDTVFGPGASQKTVFNAAVTSTLNEVLKGYSCTIFAYGQTGTGKTYTMEGERSDDRALGWEDDPVAGIIPRTVAYFYDRLKNGDYSIRVSYLEIYNEQLSDLLSARGEVEMPLKICIDRSGSACVQNLTEHIVRTKDEIFELLQRGSLKRRTAETKMNERSSRSHAVFMITLVMQQKSDIGEEVVKTGKLYLVDLAGSENISRSGAQEGRAQEAGNINKSLLTLGRVITALVERKPHIPYRDSKLSRLLQDSLGGRNKTTIVATLSPALNSLDETLSTLDYAFKAKNILNKPEINQRVSKDVHVKEVYAELEKAKRDLEATWAKVGVTLSKETYQNMQEMLDARKEKIQALEIDVQQFQNLFQESKSLADGLKTELHGVQDQFKIIAKRLEDCRKEILERDTKLAGLEHVTSTLRSAEKVNVTRFLNTVSVADETTSHLSSLHDRIGVRSKLEQDNVKGLEELTESVLGVSQDATSVIGRTNSDNMEKVAELKSDVISAFDENYKKLDCLVACFSDTISKMTDLKLWGSDLLKKLRYGQETSDAMLQIEECFEGIVKLSREECNSFVSKVEELCREARENAEDKRGEARTAIKGCEEANVALVSSLKRKIDSSVTESFQTISSANEHMKAIEEASKKLKESYSALQGVFSKLSDENEQVQTITENFKDQAVSLAQLNREQSDKAVSQLVDSFYSNLYEIKAEVLDHGQNRLNKINTDGSSMIAERISAGKAQASIMDYRLSEEVSHSQLASDSVVQMSEDGRCTVESIRSKTSELSEVIDSKLSENQQTIAKSLNQVELSVHDLSRLPAEYLSQKFSIYKPTGATPKPQPWNYDREPVVVPSNERLLSTFMPPDDLFALAEALEKADSEIIEKVKLPEPEKPVRRSESVENMANIPADSSSCKSDVTQQGSATKQPGNVNRRRALAPKTVTD